jgi:hypothetical protein
LNQVLKISFTQTFGGNMARTVVAIYDDFQMANNAVRELVDNGIARDNISIIANNTRGDNETPARTMDEESGKVANETGAGAGVGAGVGAAIGGIGGLLVGLGALTIPGIGPVIAAGPLAVALSTLTGAGVGAVTGGVTGGLLGALIGLGVPEQEAEYYAEGVRRGGVLVTVQVDDNDTDMIMEVLNRHDPIDINERATQWREHGWNRFDPNAQSMRSDMGDRPMSGSQTRMEKDMNASDTGRTLERGAEFDMENPVYRNHYSTYLADSGYPYDYYVPAYRFGYDLSRDNRYRDSNWDVVEMDARRDWEVQHPGTWERFKNSIRYAWEDITGQR